MVRLTVHTIVKNEQQWIWYAIKSVIDYAHEIIIFDTGSTDKTPSILKQLAEEYPDKITLELFENFPESDIAVLRQKQIEMTRTDWILILDGDEIWDQLNILNALELIANDDSFGLMAVRFINFVFNTKFCQDFSDSSYKIGNVTGAITLKFINLKKINPKCDGPYGVEGYFDQSDVPIQQLTSEIIYPEIRFFHMSHTIRSSSILRDFQIKYRRTKIFVRPRRKYIGKLPEVFYLDHPRFVPSAFSRDNRMINFLLNLRIKR